MPQRIAFSTAGPGARFMGIDYNRNARVKRRSAPFPEETTMAKAYWITTYRSISNPDALAAHDTPGYQEALRVLGKNSVERDMRVVEGVD
jgi:hypothetical protein